jgi:hypothetical protein
MTCLACKCSPQRACFALHQMALDLTLIATDDLPCMQALTPARVLR